MPPDLGEKTKTGVANFRNSLIFIVGAKGFEPSTPCSQSRCASRTAPYPEKKDDLASSSFFRGEGGIRTPGTLIEYDSLANCWFQPLTHPSSELCLKCAFFQKRLSKPFFSRITLSRLKAGAKVLLFFDIRKFYRIFFA